jgi:hypothetical protein
MAKAALILGEGSSSTHTGYYEGIRYCKGVRGKGVKDLEVRG